METAINVIDLSKYGTIKQEQNRLPLLCCTVGKPLLKVYLNRR